MKQTATTSKIEIERREERKNSRNNKQERKNARKNATSAAKESREAKRKAKKAIQETNGKRQNETGGGNGERQKGTFKAKRRN